MKQFLKAYTSFTRTEKAGLLGLFLLITILLTIRLTMPLWAQPEGTEELAAYAAQQTTTPVPLIAKKNNKSQQNKGQYIDNQYHEDFTSTTENNNNSQQNTTNSVPPATSRSLSEGGGGFPFDPNTIDSAGLRRLGLREKTTTIFLNWRRKGKHFYRKEELKKLYTLTPAEYKRLEPHIIINNQQHPHQYNSDLPQKININTADSITLLRLRGIGPALAHRILQKRREKGKFSNINEVLSVYHFNSEVQAYLQQKLVLE